MDLEQLRGQYAEMTDEALLEIDGGELVDAARACYEQELAQRGLHPASDDDASDGEEPEWLADGMIAMAAVGGDGVMEARQVLRRTGIPCSIVDREPEIPGDPVVSNLMVPQGQHLQATSVLDRDFFNPQVEADWKNHFEALNDQELLDIDADLLVAGMRDRIDRLVRAYEDELLKRGLAELETSTS